MNVLLHAALNDAKVFLRKTVDDATLGIRHGNIEDHEVDVDRDFEVVRCALWPLMSPGGLHESDEEDETTNKSFIRHAGCG